VPHVVRQGRADLEAAWRALPRGPWRRGSAVAKIEGCYLASQGLALLVEGVVVEYGRPLHPVVLVTHRDEQTAVHLWPSAPVERTEAVKWFLAQVARELANYGAGAVVSTNLPDVD
jgi:hypothetical protein